MAYFTPEDIQQAKQLDLLTYLQIYEPDQLVKVSGDTYCTKEHDSLKISNQDRDAQRLKFMGLDAVRKVLRSTKPDCRPLDMPCWCCSS